MLKRFWTNHRNACLLTLALLVISIVVSPWVLLAAVLPIGWVLVKRKGSQNQNHLDIDESSEAKKKQPRNELLNQWDLDQWDKEQGTLTYKPYVAGRVEGYKTREDMQNAHFLNNNTNSPAWGNEAPYDDDADGGIYFTPEWGECKYITGIEDFLKHIAQERKIKEAFFYVMWFPDKNGCFSCGNKETRTITRSMTRLSNYDKHSYFYLKDAEVEEIVHRDFPKKGCLNGSEGDIACSFAISNGKKEWEWDGKTWTHKTWIEDYKNSEWRGEF